MIYFWFFVLFVVVLLIVLALLAVGGYVGYSLVTSGELPAIPGIEQADPPVDSPLPPEVPALPEPQLQ